MSTTGSRPALPRLEPGSVERTALLARLAEARARTCLLVLGPAGSGKTSLALQWRVQALAFGHDVAWMTAMPGDDAPVLLEALLAALDRVDPAIAREARFLYNRDSGMRAPDALAVSVLRALQARGRPLTLVVDDCQNIQDARAHALLQTWLDFAPPGFHLVLVSRTVPPLQLARLRSHDALLELGVGDLRFSLEEVRTFLRTRHPEHDAGDARRLHELTDGWAAGLQLFSMDLRRGSAPLGRALPVQTPHDFSAYFHREVIAGLELEVLDRMTRLAVPDRFNLALAVALLGDEAASALLARMRREHLFVMPLEGAEREGWLRFHPLFRDLLLERFERLPADEQRATHATLAGWFGRRRLLRDAVRHGMAAGDLPQAAAWVDRWARELFLQGELQPLVRAVSELPRPVLQERPTLLLWLGWSQLCYRQFGACHETLAALQARAPEDDERHHGDLLAFSLALQEDDLATAQALLPRMQAIPQGADAVLTGGRRNLLGWMYTHMGQFGQARAVLEGTPPLREDGSPLLDSAFGSLMSRAVLGLAWLHEGNVRRAEPVLREVLADADAALGPFCEPACNAAGFLSAALYEGNDLPALRQLLDQRYDTIERVALPDSLITAAMARARLHRFDGHPREALEGLERVEALARHRGLDRALAFAWSERVRCLLQLGDAAGVEATLQSLRGLAGRHEGIDHPSSRRILGLASHADAVVHAAAGDGQDALACLERLCGPQQDVLLRRDRCAALGLRAVLLARLGPRATALQALAPVLQAARRDGMLRSLLDLGEDLLSLAADCARAEPDPALGFYVEHLQAQAGLHRPGTPGAASPPLEALSERELEVLRALAHAMSNKRIAQALGVSPETVKWHLKNVYAKLAVIGRDDAVARGRNLGLLPEPH